MSDTFTCWRCETDNLVDEAVPMGFEVVCEGCSE